jgi:predicted transporter
VEIFIVGLGVVMDRQWDGDGDISKSFILERFCLACWTQVVNTHLVNYFTTSLLAKGSS